MNRPRTAKRHQRKIGQIDAFFRRLDTDLVSHPRIDYPHDPGCRRLDFDIHEPGHPGIDGCRRGIAVE